MKIFSKIDKKVLIVLIILVILLLLVGFITYRYIIGSATKVQNSAGGLLTVCIDKCGDGVCQIADPNCGKDNNLNCVCLENSQECPQDCK